jgi:hypothetical protein
VHAPAPPQDINYYIFENVLAREGLPLLYVDGPLAKFSRRNILSPFSDRMLKTGKRACNCISFLISTSLEKV